MNAFVNADTERAVLGCALLDAESARTVAELPEDTFGEEKHRLIHSAIRALRLQEKPVDLITVDAQLQHDGTSEKSGGTGYLIDLNSLMPVTTNLKEYLKILNGCALRRRLYLAAKDLMAKAADPSEDPDDCREKGSKALQDLGRSGQGQLISQTDAVVNTYRKLGQLSSSEPDTILSGIDPLDEKTGGMRKGEMIVLGARPSVGKSILALTFCVHAAKQGKKVLLVSLEMNEVEITERIFAKEASVSMNKLVTGRLTPDEWAKTSGTLRQVSELPIWYSLEADTVEKVRRAAYSLYERGGLDLIAVDYLQLMEATHTRSQSRQEQISEISRGLRRLSQELDIPVLVLTQLNRSTVNLKKDGKRVKIEPTMSDARESGAIEQDANVFILMHDPELQEMPDEWMKKMWMGCHDRGMNLIKLIVDKNRQGKRGSVYVVFDGDHMRFLPLKKEGQT